VSIVKAFDALVVVDVAHQTGRAIFGAFTRNCGVFTEVVHALLSIGAMLVVYALNTEIEFIVTDEVLRAGGLNVAGQQINTLVVHANTVVTVRIFVAVDTDKPIGMAKPTLTVSVSLAGRIDDGVASDIRGNDVVARLNVTGSRLVEPVQSDRLATTSPSRAGTASKVERSQ